MSLALLFAHLSTYNHNHSLLSITLINLFPHNNLEPSQCNKSNLLIQVYNSKGCRHDENKEAGRQEEEKFFKQAWNLSYHKLIKIPMLKFVIIRPLAIPHNHHIFHKTNKIHHLLEAQLLNFRITNNFLLRIIFYRSLHLLPHFQHKEGLQGSIIVIKVSIAVIVKILHIIQSLVFKKVARKEEMTINLFSKDLVLVKRILSWNLVGYL